MLYEWRDMLHTMRHQLKWKLAVASILVWALSASLAHGAELDTLTDRIVGGTSLLRSHRPDFGTRALHEAALRFQQAGRFRTDQLRRQYAELTAAFREVRASHGFALDREMEFILTHLQQDLRALDGRLAPAWDAFPPDRPEFPSSFTSEVYAHGFIQSETCLGAKAAGKRPCPNQTNVLTFRLPRDAARITNLVGEWRDYGLKGKLLVHINGVRVWRTDVKKKWDRDRKALNQPVPPRATVSLRSENGDPIWIRRFEIKYARH